MSRAAMEALEIREADCESDRGEVYPLMRQLRPHLTSEAEFVERWKRQRSDGYRLIGLWSERRLKAVAGYRVIENLVHGRHLYVDDLVSSEETRGHGWGSLLLTHLQDQARSLGCAKLLLDTPLSNVLAHRFYYRNGLLATALRFAMVIDAA